MPKERILVSACLLGNKVRYDSSAMSFEQSDFAWLSANFQIVPFCPEVSAGLPIPRAPAEIVSGSGVDVLEGVARVVDENGADYTASFIRGARLALDKCIELQIKLAVLTENSPSCGSEQIYDGTFGGHRKP